LEDILADDAGLAAGYEERRLGRIALYRPSLRSSAERGAIRERRNAERVLEEGVERTFQAPTLLEKAPDGLVACPSHRDLAVPRRHHGHPRRPSRKRTGVVRADEGDRGEGLDGRESPNQRTPPGHPVDADRERDRHD